MKSEKRKNIERIIFVIVLLYFGVASIGAHSPGFTLPILFMSGWFCARIDFTSFKKK